jgi:hypothetical protein
MEETGGGDIVEETGGGEYCTMDSSWFSWYTNDFFSSYNAQWGLVPLSFKLGLYWGFQICILAEQKYALYKKGIGKIPFFVQAAFAICNIFWTFRVYQFDVYWLSLVVSIFDLLAKLLLLYFLSIRLFVVSQLNKRATIMGYILTGLGALISIIAAIPELFWPLLTTETYESYSLFYQFADLYISVMEVISIYIYLGAKFESKYPSEVFAVIKSLNLLEDCAIVLLSAILSTVVVIMRFASEEDPDSDYFFCNIVSTLKYAATCNVTVKMFQKTISILPSSVSPTGAKSNSVSKNPK